MSERESIQSLIAERLSNAKRWTAPYGILEGMQRLKKGGKCRTITFGIARYLDATIFIFSPKDLRISAQGPLAHKIDGYKFTNANELLKALDEI